jgi:hypothetical protein
LCPSLKIQAEAQQFVENDAFQFRFPARAEASDAQARSADPAAVMLQAAQRSNTVAELQKAMHDPRLFSGYSNEDEAYDSTLAKLEQIAQDERSHRDLAADPEFDLNLLAPLPMAEALRTTALKEGWSPECVYQEVRVCTAFTEHPGTCLRMRANEKHSRSACIPALRAADASARKQASS